LAAAYLELKAVRQSISEKETREAQLKQMLQQAMGDATRAEFSHGFISWKKSKDSTVLCPQCPTPKDTNCRNAKP
jgi:hypothetical protein